MRFFEIENHTFNLDNVIYYSVYKSYGIGCYAHIVIKFIGGEILEFHLNKECYDTIIKELKENTRG